MGAKKDEYFLDNRHMTKTDIVNLLESAGMSRSNPYYIVQQGKVSKLIKMRDSERLELLMDIAGTRTYDERREESLRIMQQTDRQRAAIDEVIETIERRLNELEEERKALKEYQNWDSERRALEYALNSRRVAAITERINQLDRGQSNAREEGSRLHQEAQAATAARQELEDALRQISEKRIALAARLVELGDQRSNLSADQTLAKLRLESLLEQEKADTERAQRLERELRGVEQQIQAKEQEVKEASDELSKLQEEEQQLAEKLALAEQKSIAISARLGRATQFKTKAVRDKHLREQANQLQQEIDAEQRQLKQLRDQVKSSQTAEKKAHAAVEKLKKEVLELEVALKEKKELADTTRTQLEAEQDARRQLWAQQEQLDNALQGARAAHEQANRTLQFAADREILRGVKSVKEYVAANKIKGVHGPLIELFRTERPIFDACVEAVGGNSLFNIVVDNDEIAAHLVEYLNETKGGRVTFIPLNRVRMDKVQYPPINEGIAMIDKLNFPEKVRPAIFQVYGRTVIVRDLKTGGDIARMYNLDCITTGCERVSRRGAYTGGYQEPGATLKIVAVQKLQQCADELEKAEDAVAAAQQAVLDKDQLITSLMNRVSRLNEERAQMHENTKKIRQQIDDLERELRDTTAAENTLNARIKNVESTLSVLSERLRLVNDELASPFEVDAAAVAREEKELAALTKEIESIRQDLAKVTTARADVQLRRDTEESHLTRFLYRKQVSLREELAQARVDTVKTALPQARVEVENLKHRLSEVEAEIARASEEADRLKTEFEMQQAELDSKRSEELRLIRQLAESNQAADQIIGRRAMLEKQREECQRAIQELGMLNTTKLNEYANRSARDLEADLEVANGKLKQFTHVNKRAIDQYLNFRQRREELQQRKEELDKGRNAIIELIESLDLKKDEAIDRTFKAIGLQFSLAFHELVPHGKATLVLQTRASDGSTEENAAEARESDQMMGEKTRVKSEAKVATGRKSSTKRVRRTIAEDEEEEEEKEEEEEEEEEEVKPSQRRRKASSVKPAVDEESKSASASSSGSSEPKPEEKEKDKPLPLIAPRSKSNLKYTGVGIRVSFGQRESQSKDSGVEAGVTSTSLLSGGQQSVVALALIFAIQRCDPSPFYLFDEIDANLDAVHRTAVARMINKLKPTTQFIYTTFRPELLQVGDHFAGVRFADRTTQVRTIAKREAEDLVQAQSQAITETQISNESHTLSRRSGASRMSVKV